jgi:hypothetical protein
METDIGTPIQYNPNLKDDDAVSAREEDYYYQQPPPPPMYQQHYPMMMQPPPMPPAESSKLDFSNLDKNTYIVMFIAFIVGFFMGKTMQPVILRAM